MSLLLLFAAVPSISFSVASATESASAETVVARYSLSVASATESASSETLTERVAATVTASTETASAETLVERASAAVTSTGEATSVAALAERITSAVGSATQTSSAATLAERLSLATASATETAAAASLVERTNAAIASASETASASTLSERLSVAVSVASETTSAAALTERVTSVTSSATETASASSVTSFLPPPPLPAIAALALGEPGVWFDSTDGVSETEWVDRLNAIPLTATETPVLVPNVLNSRPAVVFDGNSVFAGDVSSIGANPASWSFLLVMQRDPSNTSAPAVLRDVANSVSALSTAFFGTRIVGDVWTAENNREVGSSTTEVNAIVGDDPFVLEMYLDSHDAIPRFVVNGLDVGLKYSDNPDLPWGVFDHHELILGGVDVVPDPGSALIGNAYVAVVLPVALSVEDRQVVYDWITDVYGIALPTISTPSVSLSVESSTESASDAEIAHDSVVEPPAPIGGGGGITRYERLPDHITVVSPPAIWDWVALPARAVLGPITATPAPARTAWVVPSASVALGELRPSVAPAPRQWVALAPDVFLTPDPDEELLILSLADGL